MRIFDSVGGMDVFVNDSDEIVLRQECTNVGESSAVYIPRNLLQVVLEAIQAAADGEVE